MNTPIKTEVIKFLTLTINSSELLVRDYLNMTGPDSQVEEIGRLLTELLKKVKEMK